MRSVESARHASRPTRGAKNLKETWLGWNALARMRDAQPPSGSCGPSTNGEWTRSNQDGGMTNVSLTVNLLRRMRAKPIAIYTGTVTSSACKPASSTKHFVNTLANERRLEWQ